jgi:hypothetical protein
MSIRSVVGIEPVGHEVVLLAREVDLGAVGEVPALVEAHAEHRVAAVEQRQVDAHVGLGARVRLDVGVLGAEQGLGPLDRQGLHLVDDAAALVVPPARVSLGVLVGEDRAGGRHHRG